jgi:hypothetical protein
MQNIRCINTTGLCYLTQLAILQEAEDSEGPLGMDCTILVVGKPGSGKTATIASILESKDADSAPADPFASATGKVLLLFLVFYFKLFFRMFFIGCLFIEICIMV